MSEQDAQLETVKSLIAKWQVKLRLQDWRIFPAVARGYEIGPRQGDVSWMLSRKEAKIRLALSSDLDPQDTAIDSMELTVIHELLHLHFAPFDDGKIENDIIEQAVNCISQALYAEHLASHVP